MYPAPFAYHRPYSLAEALALRAERPDAAWLSGGHTLLPAMKNRLAAPSDLIDLRAIPELQGIRLTEGVLSIGAATTHAKVASAYEVQQSIPALALLAGSIADPQVRNMGTMGGSLANNDPSADYPAAALGLGASIVTNLRTIAADDYFTGMFSTALDEGEIILRVDYPLPVSAGYAKICSQASRYAMAASFVSRGTEGLRVAVTGAGNDGVYRWKEAETALTTGFAETSLLGLWPDPETMTSDMHGDGDYRAALVSHVTRMAVAHQGGAFIR